MIVSKLFDVVIVGVGGSGLATGGQSSETFNCQASGQAGDPFGHTGNKEPLEDGHWVLVGPAKAYFTTTEGGVRINESFHALEADGQPIEGLHAIGSNGLSGMILWGYGLHIAWAITSGHMVGKLLGARHVTRHHSLPKISATLVGSSNTFW